MADAEQTPLDCACHPAGERSRGRGRRAGHAADRPRRGWEKGCRRPFRLASTECAAFRSLQPLIEEYRAAPARARGTARADTLDSFIALVDRHQGFGLGAVRPDVVAGAQADRGHRLRPRRRGGEEPRPPHRLRLPAHRGVQGLGGRQRKPMAQDAFAAFLEEHAADCWPRRWRASARPTSRCSRRRYATPSELVALSRHLEVFVAARAKQGV